MNIALNTAVSGMLNAQAQAGAASESLVIAVKRAEATHEASAAMVKVADDMTKTLLDIIA